MSVNANTFAAVAPRTAGVGIEVAGQYFASVINVSGSVGVIHYLGLSEVRPRGSTRRRGSSRRRNTGDFFL